MSEKLLVPDIGDFEEVEVIEVLAKQGDQLNINDPVITIESDKSSVEIPSTMAGKIEKVEVKGRVNYQAELVSLDWDGYFMIKLMPKKEAQTLETTGTTVSGATTKPQSKHGEILIHTNPPSPASRPIYGFVHQPAGGDMSSE